MIELVVVAATLFTVSRPFETGLRASVLAASAERNRQAAYHLLDKLARLHADGRVSDEEYSRWVSRAHEIMEDDG